ncbi:uncharacterized WD repeat-containing protein alr2800-like [Rana temporaria]|uniref:uncharacterized WD repeat-containing protein alr2800-like n=1 Tax=Rana temporaria TaxID=8407 RepID=UPI001AACE828|nr:uncharacterized WD repeat-containing protein alr2800-like [Rana temporaria]XP_040200394.1 uncharacterized WD repeat-containing protein alr2800-like [Rana temporaria]
MAMQKHISVRDCHLRSITALGYHSARREFLTGFEDGVIKWWDLDSGNLSQSASKHSGMVTNLLYWADTKLIFSSSNDGTLIVWTSGAVVLDKIKLGSPIFSIAINFRRHLLVCGFKTHLTIYPLDEQKTCGHVINLKKSFSDHQHVDIVSCIVSLDSQIFTVGYDRKFLILDTYQTPEKICLRAVHCNSRAHDAGITHLLLIRDRECTRFLTGSFDRTVGVWSQDGQLIQRLRQFSGEITGMCYMASVKAVWITSGNSQPLVLDPRSGDVISEFVDTFQNQEHSPQIKQLVCLPETSHVIGSTKNNQVIVWKYHKIGCVAVLHSKNPLECLSYTGKKILLLFTGDSSGMVEKWEKNDSSPCVYSKESYRIEDSRPEWRGLRCLQQKQKTNQSKRPQSRLQRPGTAGILRKGTMLNNGRTSSIKSCGYTKSVFSDEMDLLVMATENGEIYLWEFDDSISGPVPEDNSDVDENQQIMEKYEILLSQGSLTESQPTQKNTKILNKHLAGFTCKKVLAGHFKAVTALAIVGKESGFSTVYLMSGGWDCRICIWDLHSCSLIETFSRPEMDHWSEQKEKACDGVILDMCYCPKRKEFAYSSSDGKVYIRHFGVASSEMTLVNILKGHEAEVTTVVWHHLVDKWITGSEDGTIRIWGAEGALCEKILHTKGVVTCICIDQMNGCIAAGVQDTIRVYDPDSLLQVQYNTGHTDLIRSLIHIPEMKQYVTVSWDKTVRIWKAYHKVNNQNNSMP